MIETGDVNPNKQEKVDKKTIGLEVDDLDYDNRAEMVVSAGGLRFFDFLGSDLKTGSFVQTYFSTYGGPAEIR